ncbi:MAG: hypothetical protein LBB07_02865, partial [Bifidobacteriaceae bacterium]|nr:hypothetical protein [Bifidobacteriaceae bacterium]
MKLINFRKIGTVLSIAVFGFISFTAGVDLTQNANSVTSASVLPINKGGTGANNANGAAANILGTNFENYSGILPLAMGGLGVSVTPSNDAEESHITAQQNLGNPVTYQYASKAQGTATVYRKVANTSYSEYGGDWADQVVLITGLTSFWVAPQSFILHVGHRNESSQPGQVYLTGLSPKCVPNNNVGFALTENGHRKVFLTQGPSTQPLRVTIIQRGLTSSPKFTGEELTAKPTENV